jgi:hypothetical protein
MFGLLFASITMMVQAGFVLGMGILLDTFLVRTVTVPAIATLVGKANWWPSDPQRYKPNAGRPRKRLAQMRKALTPRFLARRRPATQPGNEVPQSVPDDVLPPDSAAPPDSDPPRGIDDPRGIERQPAIPAATPGWPVRGGSGR